MVFLRRLLAFGHRFSPLWMIWLLLALLPATREVWQMHTLGSPVVMGYDQPWRHWFGRGRELDGFRVAKRKPRDLNAQLWRFSLQMDNLREKSDEDLATIGNDHNYNPRPNPNYDDGAESLQNLLRGAQSIQKAFPREKWLRVLDVHIIARRMDRWSDKNRVVKSVPTATMRSYDNTILGLSDQRARAFVLKVRNVAKFETNNAYYAVVEAEIWRRNRKPIEMWRALNRAAKCTQFETHDLEIARAVVKAHEAVRPLILEEKNEIWRANNGSDDRSLDHWTILLGHEGRAARKRGDHRRVIAIAAILVGVGDAMQRGGNTRAMALTGGMWKAAAWNLTPRPILTRSARRAWNRERAKQFANYAALHGRKDVAALVPKWEKRWRELLYLSDESIYYANYRFSYSSSESLMTPSKRDRLANAIKWRDMGGIVFIHGLFVSLFWQLANVFLWRGVGAPSTPPARVLPALPVAVFAAMSGWWTWRHWAIFLAANSFAARPPQQESQEMSVATVGALAFFGAPFLLAIGCAAATMISQRQQFLKSARIETELRLGRRDALLLKSGATILVSLSIFSSLFCWFLWLVLVSFDVRKIDWLAWVPNDRWNRSWSWPQDSELIFGPLGYCLLLNLVGFVLWFVKWRYFSGKDSRVLTHGGLRRWKEALGAYLVIVSALYFAVALCSWPARAQASHELEIRIARGELWP